MVSVAKSDVDRFCGLKLFAAALIAALLLVASAAAADRYHISAFNLVLGWAGVAVIAKLAEELRGLLKHRPFLLFLTSWLLVHFLVCVLSWLYFPSGAWVLLMLFELGLGNFLAHRIFKAPYPWEAKAKS